jgi:hypothetical protein
MTGRNTPTTTSKFVHTHSRTVRTVSSLNAVRFTLKFVPRIYYSRTAAVRPVREQLMLMYALFCVPF